LIGLIVETYSGFGRRIFRGAVRYAQNNTRWRLFCPMTGLDRPDPSWPRFDGVIITANTRELSAFARTLDCPVVNVSTKYDPSGLTTVCADDITMGRLAADHLIHKGFERFGALGWLGHHAATVRLRSFQERLEEAGFECHGFDWPASTGQAQFLRENDWQPVRDWLKSIVTPAGIMTTTDFYGRYLTQLCWESNIAVPEDLAFVSIGNDPLLCEASQPPQVTGAHEYDAGEFRVARERGGRESRLAGDMGEQ